MILLGSRAYAYVYKDISRISRFTDYDVIMSNSDWLDWFSSNKEFILSCIPSSLDKYKVVLEKNNIRISYEIEIGSENLSILSSQDYLLDKIDLVTVPNVFYPGFLGEKFRVLKGTFLGLTKLSHITYPIHFEKNIIDYSNICKFENRKFHLSSLSELEKTYFTLRSTEVKERSPQRTPNLNVSTDDFFSSKLPVPAYFIHDDLHRLMAHRERPIYEMMQSDSSKAWCEKDMFFDLPYQYRLEAVLEEAYVIALERYIIPQYNKDSSKDYYLAFKNAVQRICTTLTSGWFREFAYENYFEVLSLYNPSYVTKFISAYSNGLIQPKDEFKNASIPFISELKSLNLI